MTTKRLGWLTTTIQAAPRVLQLARHLRPTIRLPAIDRIDEAFLIEHRVSGILWDVDGTLMSHHATSFASHAQKALDVLGRRVPQAILSNCDDRRRFANQARSSSTWPWRRWERPARASS